MPGVASGETILTAALAELAGEVILPAGPSPATTATAQPDGSWVLDGHQGLRAGGPGGRRLLVPATSTADGRAAGVGVFIVDADADGLTLTRQTTTTGRPEAIVELAGVAVAADRLPGRRRRRRRPS